MKALVGAFNPEKALVVKLMAIRAFSVIVTNDWSFAALNNSSSQDDEADLRGGARCQDQDCIRKLHHNTPTADNSSNNRETLLH